MPRKKFAERWWELSKTVDGTEQIFIVEFGVYSTTGSMRRGILNHQKTVGESVDGEKGLHNPSECVAMCRSWIHRPDDGSEIPVSRIFLTRNSPISHLAHEVMHAALFCYRHFHNQNPMSDVSLVSNEEALADLIEAIVTRFTEWRNAGYTAPKSPAD